MFDALHPLSVSMATAAVRHVTSFPVVRDVPDITQTHGLADTQGFGALKTVRGILQQREPGLANITDD